MSRNSRNRDIYYAKLNNAAQGDPEKMMQGLTTSPYRSHRKRAERVLNNAALFATMIGAGKEDAGAA